MGSSQTTIPEDFPKTAHPALKHARINKKLAKIQLRVQAGNNYSRWRESLNPLTKYSKHLIVPEYFEDCMYELDGCCTKADNDEVFDFYMKVGYQPFIYTLENEVMMRKMSNRQFREHEIWKILKAGALGMRDWEKIYPTIEMGPLTSKSVVFNQDGHIRLVHQFSFPLQEQKTVPISYLAPEKKTNQVVKYSKAGIQSQKSTPSHIFSLGVTLLEAISLEQNEISSVTTGQKKQFLDESVIYTLDLKMIILQMTEEDLQKRACLEDILFALKKYKELNDEH